MTKKTSDILILNYLLGVVLISLGQIVLPDRYFNDSETIKTFIPGAAFQYDFLDSYNNTAYLYRLLGFGGVMPDWLAAFLSYSIPFFLVYMVARQQKWQFSAFTTGLFLLWNVLMAVYLGMFSKELWAFIVGALLMLSSKSKKGIWLGLFFVVLYASFFRIYWLLAAGFFTVNFWSAKSGKSLKFIVGFQLFAAIFVFLLANIATGQYLSEVRYTVNLERGDVDAVDAATMINNVFSNDSPIKDWLNGTLIWFSLVFPFFLLSTAQFQHLFFMVFQLLNIFAFIKVVTSLLPKLRSPAAGFSKVQKNQIYSAIAWCMAYSFVQGIFEPDFGSFAKHQVILVPMWFSLLSFYVKSRALKPNRALPMTMSPPRPITA
jgi:hypothetical protein